MKIKSVIISAILMVVGVIVWAKTASTDNYSQAKDLPNGALVYVQTIDLPQLIKFWTESKIHKTYPESQNYADFSTSHLGIKLAERLNDFNNAVGFSIDLQTLSGLTEKQAAVALYDIGKLEFVFVAPLNEQLFIATMFAQNSGKFEENSLEDGTSFYQIEFKIDRERQKQKLIFANIKGRFVLAANEKLFFRTIAAINGKQRLYDDSNFKKLSGRITPNMATIWVNQEKLNADYYFKRYWLMGKVEDLSNIKSGIFDLALNEKGMVEKREFLLNEPQNAAQISAADAKDLIAKVPEDVPFYRLQKAEKKRLGEAIYDTLFDKPVMPMQAGNASKTWVYNSFNNFYKPDFDSLDSEFDEIVNETEDEKIVEIKPFDVNKISETINSANPTIILNAASPQILENPLFAAFKKIVIISLKNPGNFQSNRFENSIIDALKDRVTVAGSNFVWETENGFRKLKIPMLGWEIGYLLENDKLFISNNFALLESFLSSRNDLSKSVEKFDDLTVIRLQNRESNFEQIMQQLTTDKNDFFTTNISSLLSVISDVKEINVLRNSDNLFLHEEILFIF